VAVMDSPAYAFAPDPVDDEPIDGDQLCYYCAGSGEGWADGSTCYHCRGQGVEPRRDEDEPIDED